MYLNKAKSVTLEQGEYLLRAKVNWRDGKSRKCVLSQYGQRKVDLVPTEFKQFWKKYFEYYGAFDDEKAMVMENVYLSHKYLNHKMYFYVENKGDKEAKFAIKFEELKNYEVGKENRGGEKDKLNFAIMPHSIGVGYLK